MKWEVPPTPALRVSRNQGVTGEDIDRALLGLGVLDGEPDPSPETTALIARLDRELAQHESENTT